MSDLQPRKIMEIIESQDGLPVINKSVLSPDQKTIESLNQDFKSLVDSVLRPQEE